MKKTSILVLALVLGARVATAREVSGVTMSDTRVQDGASLSLNGMGTRKRSIIRVYVAGLYLETPTRQAEEVLQAEQSMRLDLVMLRNLKRDQIVEAIENGVRKNAPQLRSAVRERLDRLEAQIPDQLRRGQILTIQYAPGRGTTVNAGPHSTVLPGQDFAQALFSVWLGQEPVDAGLKAALLQGGETSPAARTAPRR